MTYETHAPESLRAAATAAASARGEARKLRRIFEQSSVPMVMVDGERRYVDANRPARLTFRLSLDELRGYAVDDLTPPSMVGTLYEIWEQLLTAGWVSGSYPVAGTDGSRFQVVYWAMANALPGVHLGAFAPANWPEDELHAMDDGNPTRAGLLTPRETEVLRLASRGLSGPEIARELVLSPATVKTHFAHIHKKLDVPSRAAAVAKAMQIGLID